MVLRLRVVWVLRSPGCSPNTFHMIRETQCASYGPALDEPMELVGVANALTNIHARKHVEDALEAIDLRYRNLSPKAKELTRRQRRMSDLEILDTQAEVPFQDLVVLASEICATPISLLCIVDAELRSSKASMGRAVCETPISSSFCAHAIEQQGLFLVEDATKDERFKANPMVLGDPNIRFYAGMPLYAAEGVAVGTLCVLDTVPRGLSPGQANALAILSYQVQARMELRSERRALLDTIRAHRELTAELEYSNEILGHANARL